MPASQVSLTFVTYLRPYPNIQTSTPLPRNLHSINTTSSSMGPSKERSTTG
ncbi:hypothetical protein RSAG8_13681, partial [Rhizoctonia solani AG-8 WAC10335]